MTLDNEAIQRELSTAFEYCYLHDDWVNPLKEALAGVSAEDAFRKPTPHSTSIWEIVLHMAVWNENIVERVGNRNKAHPSEGAWPLTPLIPEDAAWERDKKRLWDSLESVRSMITATPLNDIQAAPYGIADMLCRYIHIGYHIGQITKMRELMGL